MTYKQKPKAPKNLLKSEELLTQKQLIGRINKHTAFTYRLVDLLARQIDQMDNKYRKDKENGSSL